MRKKMKETDLKKLETLNKEIITFQNEMDQKGNQIFSLKNERVKLGNNVSAANAQIRKLLKLSPRQTNPQ